MNNQTHTLKTYHRYKLKLENRQIVNIQYDGRTVNSFVEPDNRSQRPKLYVVKADSNIVYFGQTTQNMRTRLRQGLTAEGEHGYYGYPWKGKPEVDILVWCFPEDEDPKYVETIEAELVFLFRQREGQWPSFQTEIHFHDSLKRGEAELAKAILAEATS